MAFDVYLEHHRYIRHPGFC